MKLISYKNFAYAALGTLALAACKPKLDQTPISKGKSLDFTKYVSVGNSLTAGFADGGLYRDVQMKSYPNYLAGQFKLVGGGDFPQPLFSEAQKNGSGYVQITGWTSTGSPIITPVTTELAVTNATTGQLARHEGPNNNLGIPGLRMVEVTNASVAQLNPYFERLLPPLTAKKYTDFVAEANPTFFTCWLGNNDVLGYATRGGDSTGIFVSGQYPISTTGIPGTITATPLFNASTDSLINKLTANGAKGVVATIPDVATIPFVRTVNPAVAAANGGVFPRITFPLSSGLTAAQANLAYQLAGFNSPGFTTGSNNYAVYITGGNRVLQMNPAIDFFLLSGQATLTNATTGLSAGLGVVRPNPSFNPANPVGPANFPVLANPIADNIVLDRQEVTIIRTATTAFNTKLRSAAQIKGLAIVDADAIFNQIIQNNGIDGVSVNSAFISGGLFSLDGVHLTPKGYAIVANQFIKAINTTYIAQIPLIDVNARNIRGVVFP
ncbi:hypothetical protein AD998_19415 [bacterium 336/3]|nr:hypothetical protein AD998_19415 [bacterium 336/3]